MFWRNVLDENEREDLVSNIAGHLKNAKLFLQKRAVSSKFSLFVSFDYGDRS